MRKNIVAGNWKMNKTLQEGHALGCKAHPLECVYSKIAYELDCVPHQAETCAVSSMPLSVSTTESNP